MAGDIGGQFNQLNQFDRRGKLLGEHPEVLIAIFVSFIVAGLCQCVHAIRRDQRGRDQRGVSRTPLLNAQQPQVQVLHPNQEPEA